MKAILITAEAGPVVVEIPEDADHGGASLRELQRIVDGMIEALPFPNRDDTTVYINEESKFTKTPNGAATRLMRPVLFPADEIHGPMLICGFDAGEGRTVTVPDDLLVLAESGLNTADAMGRDDGLGAI